jgi:hypothetical protein
MDGGKEDILIQFWNAVPTMPVKRSREGFGYGSRNYIILLQTERDQSKLIAMYQVDSRVRQNFLW